MVNQVLIRLCSVTSHVTLLWALHTHTHTLPRPQSVQDQMGGSWGPLTPPRSIGKLCPGPAARGTR